MDLSGGIYVFPRELGLNSDGNTNAQTGHMTNFPVMKPNQELVQPHEVDFYSPRDQGGRAVALLRFRLRTVVGRGLSNSKKMANSFGTIRFDHGTVFLRRCNPIFPKELGIAPVKQGSPVVVGDRQFPENSGASPMKSDNPNSAFRLARTNLDASSANLLIIGHEK